MNYKYMNYTQRQEQAKAQRRENVENAFFIVFVTLFISYFSAHIIYSVLFF